MRLAVVRRPSVDGVLIGRLTVNGYFECWTLEESDVAIPLGTYPVDITFSNRFQRMLPILKNVPGRSGIRIHPGNTKADTSGCILVGETFVGLTVEHSRDAMANLQAQIAKAIANREDVTITLLDEEPDTRVM